MNEEVRTRPQGRAVRAAQLLSSRLAEIGDCTPDEALLRLDSARQGLTEEQVEERRDQFGVNEITHERPPTWYSQLFWSFITPFNGVLFAVSLVSLFTDVIFAAPEDRSFRTIIVLMTMVLLSTLLRFWQEYRSNKAAEELKAMVRSTTAVLRADTERAQEIPISELVPGDIVVLAAGDMIPADVRVLSAKDLFVSQAMLTGESIPVEKHPARLARPSGDDAQRGALDLETICFMGSNVVSGTATAVVAMTGDATYFGAVAKDIAGARPLTSFDIGISRVSWLLIRFIAAMTPVVFLINGFTKHNWLEALLFAVSVAVGLTPEMLPMIVTANLAKGAVVMARRKTIVKRLNAIQNFGAMDILCTDKTGTLTQNKVILEKHLDLHGEENSEVLAFAWLNSFHQTGLKNLMDVAVLEYADLHGVTDDVRHFRKVDEIPFDFVRRRMSVVVRNGDNRNLLICKGAIEELMPLCEHADTNCGGAGEILPFTDAARAEARAFTRDLNEDGLRALAVAYKWMPAEDRTYTVADEIGLTLAGYVAFLDPPKETAHEAIAALADHGIAVKIITGDNDVVTRKICKEVALPVEGVLLGREVEALSDDELAQRAEHITIFAKTSPLQKSRVIRALKSRGHTVGYLGDGINDAAALKDADVGISVDSAVDVAKESADIILLERSLMVLEEAVIEGRKTFANINKYIKMTASSNFGNVFSVLIASTVLPFLPMLPIQLLTQNLLYDISQVSIPWDDVDRDYLKAPRKWDAGGLARFMMFIGPISSIFDVVTFAVMWFVFGARTPAEQSLFQTGWFVVGLLTQTLIVHMIRTQQIPFIQSRASTPVISLTASIMALGIILPFTPVGAQLGMVALPPAYFPWLVGILLCYCTLTQIVKRFYISRFHQWL
ncbi:MAG TPA: magnesium-translocating P-type ATPase [Micropepsaceae bacterium]|nr:magnesium-translocating P-type ATPase [Micropepsaceae bacterium]